MGEMVCCVWHVGSALPWVAWAKWFVMVACIERNGYSGLAKLCLGEIHGQSWVVWLQWSYIVGMVIKVCLRVT